MPGVNYAAPDELMPLFGGLAEGESAEVLQVSRETVKRGWKLAKTQLPCEMTEEVAGDETGAMAGD